MEEKKHRLTINIPKDLFKEVKAESEKHYCTVTNWIIRAALERLKKDKQYQ